MRPPEFLFLFQIMVNGQQLFTLCREKSQNHLMRNSNVPNTNSSNNRKKELKHPFPPHTVGVGVHDDTETPPMIGVWDGLRTHSGQPVNL